MAAAPQDAARDTVTARIDNGWTPDGHDPTDADRTRPVSSHRSLPTTSARARLRGGASTAFFWEALRGFAAPAPDQTAAARRLPTSRPDPGRLVAADVTASRHHRPRVLPNHLGGRQPLAAEGRRHHRDPAAADAPHRADRQLDQRLHRSAGMAGEPRIAVGVIRVAYGDYMRCARPRPARRRSAGCRAARSPRSRLRGGDRGARADPPRGPLPQPLLLLAGQKDRAIPSRASRHRTASRPPTTRPAWPIDSASSRFRSATISTRATPRSCRGSSAGSSPTSTARAPLLSRPNTSAAVIFRLPA